MAREWLPAGVRAEGVLMRAAVKAEVLAGGKAWVAVAVDGGVRERLIVVAARGKLMVGALEVEDTLGCLRTLTAAEDARIKLGVLPLNTRAGTDF